MLPTSLCSRYEVTHSAVIRIRSVFFVLGVASICGVLAVLDDVPNAYVKGTIKEKIYMKPPVELELAQEKVILFMELLYGLK